jgi:transcriptional regulator with PAS, ATPase and Fis domain
VNCASLPETILESELFGLERGTFSGAYAVQKGRVELAEGGTLFLDEVGALTASLQVKLLRLIQTGKFTHPGGDHEIDADVRVIAATSTDLAEAVRSKEFREDLFYQLDVISIHLPPLRERREDIRHLVTSFADRFSRRHRQPPLKVPAATLELLMQHPWPGNIRELQNCVEKAVVLQDLGALIPQPEGTPSIAFHKSATIPAEDEAIVDLGEGGRIRPLHEVAADAQRAAVVRAIKLCDNNKAEAAKRLDVSYKTLFNKIHELGIQFQTTIE